MLTSTTDTKSEGLRHQSRVLVTNSVEPVVYYSKTVLEGPDTFGLLLFVFEIA